MTIESIVKIVAGTVIIVSGVGLGLLYLDGFALIGGLVLVSVLMISFFAPGLLWVYLFEKSNKKNDKKVEKFRRYASLVVMPLLAWFMAVLVLIRYISFDYGYLINGFFFLLLCIYELIIIGMCKYVLK